MDDVKMDFIKLLYDIDSNLGQEDFESLKFLCMDRIPNKKLEKFKQCLEVFEELQKCGDLSEDNTFILAELLYLIGQHNLLRMLGTNKTVMKKELNEQKYVSMYRRMLFELSENITKQDQSSITFLLDLPIKFKENKGFLDILCYLDKSEIITEDNLDVLEKVISRVSRELLKKITQYKEYRVSTALQENVMPSVPTENTHMPSSETPYSIQAVSSTDTELNDATESIREHIEEVTELSNEKATESIREHIEEVTELPNEKDVEAGNYISALSLEDQTPSGVYRMNRKHRGYCIVINNSIFLRSGTRQGTEKDAEYLGRVFTWLGFYVLVYNEKKADEILAIMKDFQKKDHSDRDCFVCCILTHGQSRAILGTDSEPVSIDDIVSNFSPTNCKTLAGKPKMFFVQACQGKSTQAACEIEEDAVAGPKTIPHDADILIGMSTVDGYFSYRHIEKGTWYIQALCSNLIKMVPRGEDILSILTVVNKEVSEKESIEKGNARKQMPQPTYTLRKKLVFPIPSCVYSEKM